MFKIRQPERIIQEVRDVLTSWKTYADLAGVESDSKKLIGKEYSTVTEKDIRLLISKWIMKKKIIYSKNILNLKKFILNITIIF